MEQISFILLDIQTKYTVLDATKDTLQERQTIHTSRISDNILMGIFCKEVQVTKFESWQVYG